MTGFEAALQKGAKVRVRCEGGQTRQNVVWEDHGDVVLVCAKDQFERLSKGYRAPMPIGFRRADVTAIDIPEDPHEQATPTTNTPAPHEGEVGVVPAAGVEGATAPEQAHQHHNPEGQEKVRDEKELAMVQSSGRTEVGPLSDINGSIAG